MQRFSLPANCKCLGSLEPQPLNMQMQFGSQDEMHCQRIPEKECPDQIQHVSQIKSMDSDREMAYLPVHHLRGVSLQFSHHVLANFPPPMLSLTDILIFFSLSHEINQVLVESKCFFSLNLIFSPETDQQEPYFLVYSWPCHVPVTQAEKPRRQQPCQKIQVGMQRR